MRTVAIIQARMTSTRLPGKVLMPLAGRPMLAQQLRRVRACSAIDEIVIATTENASDDAVARLAAEEGAACFRGDEQDVLGRYLHAARAHKADVVIRLTADCPLVDAEVIARVAATLAPGVDYASNVLKRTFPRGLDTEAFLFDTLERIADLARAPHSREHVTTFLREERPELFVTHNVEDREDNSDLRWTVDEPADFAYMERLFAALDLDRQPLRYREILQHVRAHPELAYADAARSG